MFTEKFGIGSRPFIGLHGWGSDRAVFAPLKERIPNGVSFYAADLPGCGSTLAPAKWSLDAIVADIIETIRSVESRPVTIVGHCGGAVFGLLAARIDEDLIERVVAIDPFAYLPRYLRLFTGEGFGRHAYDATFASSLGRRITSSALNAGRENKTDLTASFEAVDHESARNYLDLFASIDSVEEFRGIKVDVDLVYGERSFRAVKKSIEMFREVLPQARTVKLTNARHMPFSEATAEMTRILFSATTTANARLSST